MAAQVFCPFCAGGEIKASRLDYEAVMAMSEREQTTEAEGDVLVVMHEPVSPRGCLRCQRCGFEQRLAHGAS